MGKTALTLAYLVLLSSCTALTNFGEFVFEDLGQNQDMLVRDLTPGPDLNCGIPAVCDTDGKSLLACGVKTECRCIGGSLALGYPAHCAPIPSNGIDLADCNSATAGKDITLTKDAKYQMNGNNLTNTNTDANESPIPLGGKAMALLCVNNLAAENVTIVAMGERPFAIVADSTVNYTGLISIAGSFANLPGVAAPSPGRGGPGGGDGGNKGAGGQLQIAPMNGGKGGSNTAGGGGGGGNVVVGGSGGKDQSTMSAPGGMAHNLALLGGGGGGGASDPGSQPTSGTAGFGGGGGGTLQLTAGVQLKLQIQIDATGGAGGGGGPGANFGSGSLPGGGGGGAGAGGTIFIEAPDVQLNGGRSCISVHGGSGGMGGYVGGPVDGGYDPGSGIPVTQVSVCPYLTVPAVGKGPSGGDPDPAKRSTAGKDGNSSRGSGGGAGAPGRVTVRSQNEYKANATDLPVQPAASFTWQAYSP